MNRSLTIEEQDSLGRLKEFMGMSNEPAWYFWTVGKAEGMDFDCAEEMRDAFREVGFLDYGSIEAGAPPVHKELLLLGANNEVVQAQVTAGRPKQGGKENPRIGLKAPKAEDRDYRGRWHDEQKRLLDAENDDVVVLLADYELCVALNVTQRVKSGTASLDVLEPFFVGSSRALPLENEEATSGKVEARKTGYESDPENAKKLALDRRAMEVVRGDLEGLNWQVEDNSKEYGGGHDLSAVNEERGLSLRFEVKGSRLSRQERPHVTGTQVRLARQEPRAYALVVVDGIRLRQGPGGPVGVGGNQPRYYQNWDPREPELVIDTARYNLAESVHVDAKGLGL